MKDVTVQVSDVGVSYEGVMGPPRVSFSVCMVINTLSPESDADGELFCQRFGADILDQVVTLLRTGA